MVTHSKPGISGPPKEREFEEDEQTSSRVPCLYCNKEKHHRHNFLRLRGEAATYCQTNKRSKLTLRSKEASQLEIREVPSTDTAVRRGQGPIPMPTSESPEETTSTPKETSEENQDQSQPDSEEGRIRWRSFSTFWSMAMAHRTGTFFCMFI